MLVYYQCTNSKCSCTSSVLNQNAGVLAALRSRKRSPQVAASGIQGLLLKRRRYAASQEAIDSFCAYSPHSIKTHHIHGIPTLDGTLFEQRTNTMLYVIHMLFGLVQLGSLRNMKRATRHQASHHDAGLRNQRIKAHDIGYQKKTPKRIVHVA